MFDNSSRSMRQMRQDIPEIIEIFEQSREYLEILRNGQFANLGGAAGVSDILYIHYLDHGGIPYEEWDAIEWLSDEERGAILFLLGSDELSRNFIGIGSPTGDGIIVAGLYRRGSGPRNDNIQIRHGGAPDGRLHDSYTVVLDSGYVLWLYTRRDQ